MKWSEFSFQERVKLILAIFFCILLGIRYYPGNWSRTLFESFRWIFAFFFYSAAMTFILHGLLRKIFKKTFSFKTGVKLAMWLAVLFALSQSFHEIFFPEYRGSWSDILRLLGLSK